MEFQTDISKLKDCDLPRYVDHLLDIIWEKSARESVRAKILDRVSEVYDEMISRGLREEDELSETLRGDRRQHLHSDSGRASAGEAVQGTGGSGGMPSNPNPSFNGKHQENSSVVQESNQ